MIEMPGITQLEGSNVVMKQPSDIGYIRAKLEDFSGFIRLPACESRHRRG